jgi:uncharacterized protein (TIGR02231 family)
MNRNILNGLTVVSLFLICTEIGLAEELDTKITRVTLYPNLALVTREGDANLSLGENQIEIANLPGILSDESVRLRIDGENGIQIQNVRIETWFLEKPEEQKIKQLQQQIEAVEQEMVKGQNDIQVWRTKEKFLASIQVTAGQQASQALALGKADAVSWSSTIDFLGKNLAVVYSGIAEAEARNQELKNKKEALQRQLLQVQAAKPKEEKAVSFVIQANKPLAAHLVLEYLISDVSWTPRYEIHALPTNEKVELHYNALISQLTGEEWDNVDLVLSTASPSRGAQVPEMHPWNLSLPREMLRKAAYAPAAPTMAMESEAKHDQVTAFAAAQPSEAEVKGVSVAFNLTGKWNIPSSTEPVKVDIMNKTLPVKLSYAAVPKLAPSAFLKGVFTNATDYPLLGGSASVYVDGDFVGNINLKNMSPTEEAELSLGSDDGIRIKHELVKRFERNKGLLNKRVEIEYSFKITLENFKAKPVTIEIKDQVPRSTNEAITVEDISLTPEPKEWNKDSGEIKWEMSLEPKKKTEISLQFVIGYPRGQMVIGLP